MFHYICEIFCESAQSALSFEKIRRGCKPARKIDYRRENDVIEKRKYQTALEKESEDGLNHKIYECATFLRLCKWNKENITCSVEEDSNMRNAPCYWKHKDERKYVSMTKQKIPDGQSRTFSSFSHRSFEMNAICCREGRESERK